MMKTIDVDESQWPLVVVRYARQVDEGEFEELLRALEGCQKRAFSERTKMCIIYDASLGYQASPRIRRRQAEWNKEQAERTRLGCAGVAFVMNSVLVRGVLTAVLWMSEMHAPYTVEANMDDALSWCRKQLRAIHPTEATRSVPG